MITTDDIAAPFCLRLDHIIRRQLYYGLIWVLLLAIQTLAVALFLSHLIEGGWVGIAIAGLLLTLFGGVMLGQYQQVSLETELQDLQRHFVDKCRERIGYTPGHMEHHAAVASASAYFANQLERREERYLASFLSPLSRRFFHPLIFRLQELLLKGAVQEQLALLKTNPTKSDVHIALATAYVMLSGLYRGAEQEEPFKEAALKAVEEFKILEDLNPEDPWVHAQLAYSYHDLNQPAQEIAHYEKLLRLRPGDSDSLFKLGSLYFKQRRAADGLKIYEHLRINDPTRALQLIESYGNEW